MMDSDSENYVEEVTVGENLGDPVEVEPACLGVLSGERESHIDIDISDDDCNANNTGDRDCNSGRYDDSEEEDEDIEGIQSEEDEEGNTPVLVMPQRKMKIPAPVWKCVSKVEGGAKCNFCHQIFKLKGSTTTNIFRHVTEKHQGKPEVILLVKEQSQKNDLAKQKILKEKKIKEKQPSILNFARKSGIMDPIKKKKMDEALVRMTIGMNSPFEDVENHFLRDLLFIAEPNYICPSRKTHTERFDKCAKKVRGS